EAHAQRSRKAPNQSLHTSPGSNPGRQRAAEQRRDGENQKAASAAAFDPISRFSATKSTKTSASGPAMTTGIDPGFPPNGEASWGKPKKRIRAAGPTLVTESADKVV